MATYYCRMDWHEEGDGRYVEADSARHAAEKYVERHNQMQCEYPDERLVIVVLDWTPQKFVVYTHHVPEYEARPVKATRKDA